METPALIKLVYMARPPKSPDERRTERLQVMLTPGELRRLQRESGASGRDLSEIIRDGGVPGERQMERGQPVPPRRA